MEFFRWVIKKIVVKSVNRKREFCGNQFRKKERNCFSENNSVTLNQTQCRSSPVQDANKSNQSDNESSEINQ